MIDKQKQGRINRQSGSAWEHKVRDDMIAKGWNVSKFQSNVGPFLFKQKGIIDHTNWKEPLKPENWVDCKLIPAQTSNRFRRGTLGFPDFICWKVNRHLCRVKGDVTGEQFRKIQQQLEKYKDNPTILTSQQIEVIPDYEIIGVEAKSNRGLDKIERAKCKWLIENRVFSKIFIAKKKKVGRKVIPEYINFAEKYL